MADRQFIEIRGARENNSKDISLDIPKQQITVFTGVSGSGKSSLVFGTIAAESQRMINETYSAFVQGFMPALARPDVDVMDGLTTAIIVDQERMGLAGVQRLAQRRLEPGQRQLAVGPYHWRASKASSIWRDTLSRSCAASMRTMRCGAAFMRAS